MSFNLPKAEEMRSLIDKRNSEATSRVFAEVEKQIKDGFAKTQDRDVCVYWPDFEEGNLWKDVIVNKVMCALDALGYSLTWEKGVGGGRESSPDRLYVRIPS